MIVRASRRHSFCAMVMIATALVLLPGAADADNVTVDCSGSASPPAFPTIGSALASLDRNGPHVITVSGTCSENVDLRQRDRVTIQAPPAQVATIEAVSAAFPAVGLASSHAITLQRLAIEGGLTGVSADQGSDLTLRDLTISGSAGSALAIQKNSVVVARNVTLENSGGAGIELSEGGEATLQTLTVRGNGRAGLSASIGAKARVLGAAIFQNNGENGIVAFDDAVVTLQPDGSGVGSLIEGHSRSGVAALFGSTIVMGGAHVVRGNGSPSDPVRSGVAATHNSHLRLTGGLQITGNAGPGLFLDASASARLIGVTVSGNSEEGIRVQHLSAVEVMGATTSAGNGGAAASCDATSIAYGDAAAPLRPGSCKDK